MPFESGTKLGAFEITSLLGTGGMGEVYRARDTKLGRDVALKVVAEKLAHDPDYVARFEREARVLAALDHPNIAAIYEFGRATNSSELNASGEVVFLVMQLVEGETLASHISAGPGSVRETLPIFVQIARGLDAAHEAGIVHRDLKPANVKLGRDGSVKLIDFGIAKSMLVSEPVSDTAPTTPIVGTPITTAGMLIGTPSYMSPEQARGKPVDRRTDVWAFGCCLFETLTGEAPFQGETVTDLVVAILEREPDWSKLPALPSTVDILLRRCLEKRVSRRVSSMGDVALLLEDAAESIESGAQPGHGGSLGENVPLCWEVVRLSLPLAPDAPLAVPGFSDYNVIVSKDGMTVIYVAEVGDTNMLMMRRLDEHDWRPISGSEGACQPFFSSDQTAVAFFDRGQRQLKRIALAGGRPTILCEALVPFGGCWHDDGFVYFGGAREHALVRVSESGGQPEPVIPLSREAGAVGLGHPNFIHGRNAMLFASAMGYSTDYVNMAVYIPRTAEIRTIAKGVMNPKFLPTGHVLYAPNGALLAAPFDKNRLEQTAPPVDVSEPQMIVPARTPMHYAVSDTGTLVYVPEATQLESENDRRMVWVDHDGNVEPMDLPPRHYQWPRVSPDGRSIAVAVFENSGRSIWTWNAETTSFRKITFGNFDEHTPLWTPDGERIVFTSNRGGGAYGLHWVPADGSDDPEPLPGQPRNSFAYSWSPDGAELVVHHIEVSTGRRLAVVNMRDGSLRQLSGGQTGPACPALSPDGRWIVYTSDETGQSEIFVQSYPELRGKWQISRQGGTSPVWSSDGTALYYIRGHRMHRVETRLEPKFQPGAERELFELPCVVDRVFGRRMFDITPDGSKFLMILEGPRKNDRAELRVVLNWFREIERLVPVK